MTRIGIIGMGFMGMIHSYALRKKHTSVQVRGAKLVAFSTRDAAKRKGDWSGIQGNFGPRGAKGEDLRDIRAYADWRELIDDPNIDLVDITLPNHLHRDVAIAALESGKDVLVEKPIAVSLADGRAMIRAAERTGHTLMVAHVLPFFAEFAFALNACRRGTYGKLTGGHFRRIIAQPTWSAELMDNSISGGPGIDLHIHDTHFIQLICGMPKSVVSHGMVNKDGTADYLITEYRFGKNGPVISCASGAVAAAGRPFTHGYELYFENATLTYELGSQPLTVIKDTGKSTQPRLTAGGEIDAFVDELQYAVDVVRGKKEPSVLDGSGALTALNLCWKEARSAATGKTVRV